MSEYPEIVARFARETKDHAMTVLHEDGLYRHLVFADPVPNFNRFDLVTWPHGLLIRADGPTFAFALWPTEDLFEMFRATSSGGINPGYWHQKVTAGKATSWSEEMFRTWLTAKAEAGEASHKGLAEAVKEQILESNEHNLECEDAARTAVAWFSHDSYNLEFPAKWEQDFDDWSWGFLWACHAIRWGIAQYDAVKAVPKAVA